MGLTQTQKIGSISAVLFLIFISLLTAMRVWNLEPTASIQSLLVNSTALVLLIAVAFSAYHGDGFLTGWVLAFGPSLAFTLNLFLPVATMALPLKIVSALLSAAFISVMIGGLGYISGRILREVEHAVRSPNKQ